MWDTSCFRFFRFFFNDTPQEIQHSKNSKDKVSKLSELEMKRVSECVTIGPQASVITIIKIISLVDGLLLADEKPEIKSNAIREFKTYYHFDLSSDGRKKLGAHVIQLAQTGECLFFSDVVKKLSVNDVVEDKYTQFFIQFLTNYCISYGVGLMKTPHGERFKDIIDIPGAEWVIAEFSLPDNKTAHAKLIALKNKLSEYEALKECHDKISELIPLMEKNDDINYQFWFSSCMLTYIYTPCISLPSQNNETKLLWDVYNTMISDCGNDTGSLNEPYIHHSNQKANKTKHQSSAAASSSRQSSSRNDFDDYWDNLNMFP